MRVIWLWWWYGIRYILSWYIYGTYMMVWISLLSFWIYQIIQIQCVVPYIHIYLYIWNIAFLSLYRHVFHLVHPILLQHKHHLLWIRQCQRIEQSLCCLLVYRLSSCLLVLFMFLKYIYNDGDNMTWSCFIINGVYLVQIDLLDTLTRSSFSNITSSAMSWLDWLC